MSDEDEIKRQERALRDAEIEAIKREMMAGAPKKKVTVDSSNNKDTENDSESSSSDDSSSSSSEDSDDDSSSGSSPDSQSHLDSKCAKSLPSEAQLVRSGFHARAVTCIALDKNGTRMVTGSIDGSVLLWDTAKLNTEMRPFRTMSTTSSLTGGSIDQAVTAIGFNSSSSVYGVARSDPQVRIYTRDGTNGANGSGEAKVTTTRGDNYIRDMSKTKGHVGGVSALTWHSSKSEILFTSGMLDGTVRVWDIEHGPKALMNLEIMCTHILKTIVRPGARTSIQALCRSSTSQRLIAGCSGANIQLWDARMGGVFGSSPDKRIEIKSFGAEDEFVSLSLDEADTYLAVASKRHFEMRDARKLDDVLWSSVDTPSILQVKYTGFHKSCLVVGTTNEVLVLSKATGERQSVVAEPGLSSNIVWQGAKFIRGKSDGTIVLSFDEGSEEATMIEENIQSRQALQSRSLQKASEGYAHVDQSSLEGGEGKILTGYEARKLLGGSKSKKQRVADDESFL